MTYSPPRLRFIRRVTSTGAFVALLLVAIATFAGAASAAEKTSATGKLIVTQRDGKTRHLSTEYALQRPGRSALKLLTGAVGPNARVNAVGPNRGAVRIEESLLARSGQNVTVTGSMDGGTMSVSAVSGPLASASYSGGNLSVGVVLINFSDNTAEPWTPAQANDLVFGNTPNSTKTFYEQASYGSMTLTGNVLGWYHLSASASWCNRATWVSEVKQMAGTALDGYDRLMYVFPQNNDCGWNGIADPTEVFINGVLDNNRTPAHELGHSIGFAHSNALECGNGTQRVTLAASGCKSVEYGDPFDVMGAGHRLFNTVHRLQSGLMPIQNLNEAVNQGPQSLYDTALHGTGTPQILAIPRSYDSAKPYYALELRDVNPWFDDFASNDPAVTGVSIRIAKSLSGPESISTTLLDMTPETATYDDAPLQPGHTFYDPIGNFSIVANQPVTDVARVSWLSGPQSTVTAAVSGGVLTVAGTASADSLAVSHTEDDYRVTSNSGSVAAGAGCTPVQTNEIACAGQSVTSLVVNAGNGDDSVYWVGSGAASFDGGDGNDTLSGGTSNDTFDGGAGNDKLLGGSGKDTLRGGIGDDELNGESGDDTLDGGTGNDYLIGSNGFDVADYSSRTASITTHAGPIPGNLFTGDPALGENDQLSDIDRVLGGTGNDALTTTGAVTELYGGSGADSLTGGTQDEMLVGGAGVDTLASGAGDDTIDSYDGGADTVSCGSGSDRVKADAATLDPLSAGDCETADRTPETFIGSGPAEFVKTTAVSFTFSGSVAGATFKCAMDAGAYSTCTSPFSTTAAAGTHTFRVKASVGTAQDPTEATRQFTVDTTVPNTTISSTAPVAWDNTPRFLYTSTEAESRFECSVDSTTAYKKCGLAFTTATLTDASHTVRVRAIDRAGNVDATPASQTFTVAAPHTVIVGGGVLRYSLPAGQDDLLFITKNGTEFTVQNSNYPVTAGTGCTQDSTNYVRCSSTAVSSIYIDGADGDDQIFAEQLGVSVPLTFDGNAGNDYLMSGDGNDVLSGGAGDDILSSGTGTDTYIGGPGDDLFAGSGNVTYDYMDRTADLDVRILEASGLVGGAASEHDTRNQVIGQPITVKSGTGNDFLWASTSGIQSLDGGPGDDYIRANAGVSTLNGGDGQDTIEGSAAVDTINGGSGDDTLTGNGGADVFNGNAGVDTVSYATRSNAQTVTIDGTANDGDATDGASPTARDNVKTDVENVTGGSGNDSLTGTTGSSSIANLLSGGAGNDTLVGNDGNDSLVGGIGVDTTNGGTGNDTINIRDGAGDATATCGSGSADVLLADLATLSLDTSTSGCELITRW